MQSKFAGLWPAMVTPMTPAGAPNLQAIEQLVELFIRQRLDGLYILGSTGQWPLLSMGERRAVAERVLQVAKGRISVIVHVGAPATDDAVALARHAAECGADGVASVPPIYYPLSPEEHFEHYQRIGQATDLPFFVYHLAGIAATSLEPREYADRLLRLPNIAGMKITDRDLYLFGLLRAYTNGKLALFSGADEVLCHAVLSGATGAVGSFYNVWGPACRAARAACTAGEMKAAERFMLAFQSALAEVQASGSTWGFWRSAIRIKYAIDIGCPRAPLATREMPWNDADVERLIEQVEKAAPARR